MGKGRFLNQKLGKNVSRKFDLLKSELAGCANRKPSSRPVNLPVPKKGNLSRKTSRCPPGRNCSQLQANRLFD